MPCFLCKVSGTLILRRVASVQSLGVPAKSLKKAIRARKRRLYLNLYYTKYYILYNIAPASLSTSYYDYFKYALY